MSAMSATGKQDEDACDLCAAAGGELVWQDERCRVIRVEGREGAEYPGFCRVVWHAHVREMTDLPEPDRQYLMRVVYAVESSVRDLYRPDKINLASLGNLTPHLHWHVIPRRQDDPNFPAPIWATPTPHRHRDSAPSSMQIGIRELHDRLLRALAHEEKDTLP